MTDQSSQITIENQSTYTFYREQSKDNPETILSAVVDSQTKIESTPINNAKIILQNSSRDVPDEAKIINQQTTQNKQDDNLNNHSPSFPHTPKLNHFRSCLTQAEDEDEQQNYEMNSYRNLTLKLQTALNKISSSKKVSKASGSSKSFIERFQRCQEKKKQIIALKQQQKQLKELNKMKQKPTIDKNSQKIVKEINHEPIYMRFEKIVENKKKKYAENEQAKKRQLQQKELEYFEQFKKHQKKPESIRSYEVYFKEMRVWKEKKNQQNKQKLQVQVAKEMESLTFKPILNPKSKKLVSAQQNRLPIDQRGLIKKKVQPTYSFTPNILHKKSEK